MCMEAAPTTPGIATNPPGPERKPLRTWVLAIGYIGAVLAPLVGVVIGMIALARRQTAHAAALFLIAAAVIGLGIAVGRDGDTGNAPQPSGDVPGQIDLSRPKWKDFEACAKAQGHAAERVVAHCHIPGTP